MLKRFNAPGGYGAITPPPPPRGHPPWSDIPQTIDQKPEKSRGVMRVHPLGCLTLRGRDGVTPLLTDEDGK